MEGVFRRHRPLGEERVCVFFGGTNFAGCWERYDAVKGDFYNRNDHRNDHTYLMRTSLSQDVKQAVAEEHNQRVYCVRVEYMHLSCPRGGVNPFRGTNFRMQAKVLGPAWRFP